MTADLSASIFSSSTDVHTYAKTCRTNPLMHACDLLVTKPSEPAFHLVPKLMIRRRDSHEAWSPERAAKMGVSTRQVVQLAQVERM